MPIHDLYETIDAIANDAYFRHHNPTGVIGMYPAIGLNNARTIANDRHVSEDSDERWFLMGISVWGADAEGIADIVGE